MTAIYLKVFHTKRHTTPNITFCGALRHCIEAYKPTALVARFEGIARMAWGNIGPRRVCSSKGLLDRYANCIDTGVAIDRVFAHHLSIVRGLGLQFSLDLLDLSLVYMLQSTLDLLQLVEQVVAQLYIVLDLLPLFCPLHPLVVFFCIIVGTRKHLLP